MKTRQEHLAWCKQRALEYLQPGEFFSLDEAMASMASDIGKNEENHRMHSSTVAMMLPLRASGRLETADEMREFIEGFN